MFEGALLDGRWRLVKRWHPGKDGLYEAHDEEADVPVMVALLSTAWIPSSFLEQKRLGALIGHRAFVRVLEVGCDPKLSRAFAVQEAPWTASSRWLSVHLEEGPADLQEALSIARELLSAMAAAHAKNVILGLIDAGSILVDAPDASGVRVKILADLVGSSPASDGPYAAPELRGAVRFAATVASDLYAVGALLHHMLTGALPAVRDGKPEPIRSELGVPLPVQQAIWRALETDPEKRFRSAAELRAALDL